MCVCVCFQGPSIRRRKKTGRRRVLLLMNYVFLQLLLSPLVGAGFYFPLSVSVRLFLTLSVSVNSPGTSVGLGRHRSLSSRLYRSYDVELPEEHHGSLPPDASGQRSQGYRRHGNAKNVWVFFWFLLTSCCLNRLNHFLFCRPPPSLPVGTLL